MLLIISFERFSFILYSLIARLLKIYIRLHRVRGMPVISNDGTPTEKVSENLDNELKLIIEDSCVTLKILMILCLR